MKRNRTDLRDNREYRIFGGLLFTSLMPGSLLLITIMMTMFYCTDEYNPFTDVRNARAYLGTSFADGDTVTIFSTETLEVVLAVKDLIDTISVSAGANRYFTDTVVTRGSPGWPSGASVSYLVSFYDTGWQEIRCVTRRQSGEEVVQQRTCYVRSPLKQQPLSDTLGDTICLSTPPVGDRDVVYKWAFGGGVVVQSVPNTVCRKVPVNGVSTVGQLWVAELNGNRSSPRTRFEYRMVDEDGPKITCVNEGAVGKDTIATASEDMYLQVQIVDGSGGRIYNASVNGSPFDVVRDQVYFKTVSTSGLLSHPELFTVRAYDPYSNLSEKKLWVVYDPEAEVTTGARIVFVVPSTDTLMVAKKQLTLFGRVVLPGNDPVDLSMECRINGSPADERLDLHGSVTAEWVFPVELEEGGSVITVIAYDSSGTEVAGASRVVIYDREMEQVSFPVVVELQVDRKTVTDNPVTVENDDPTLRIFAFDQRSEITTVLCNGKVVTAAAEGSGYLWETGVSAVHSAEGSRYILYLENRNGLSIYDTVSIRQNRDPLVVRYPQPPLPLLIGTTYIDTISATDPDGDPVRYKKSDGPKSLAVDSVTGCITWMPGDDDQGTDTVGITLQDAFGAQLYSFPVQVFDRSDVPETIRFVTKEEDFPAVLEVGRDTMKIPLQVVPGTGKEPFTFTVVTGTIPASSPFIEDEVVYWAPQWEDTGKYLLTVTVVDSFKNRAQLFPHIMVVPPNRSFTLSSRWTGDTTANGIYAMYSAVSPESLLVTVLDPDTGAADTITALLVNVAGSTPVPVNGRSIIIPVAPRNNYSGLDTMTLLVSDRAGHTGEFVFMVYYGAPPSVPRLLIPVSDSIVRDSSVTFAWDNSDPDGAILSHTLYLAVGETALAAVAEVQGDNTVTVQPLLRTGRYYWQIRSSDGIAATSSAMGTFVMDQPNRVRFATGTQEIPAFLRAETDTLLLPLRLTEGTGRAPYTVSMGGFPSTVPLIDGMTVRWIPQTADTGVFRCIITVRDDIGNSDTLSRMLQVLPLNRAPVLSLTTSVPVTETGALDLSAASGPVDLVVSVQDPDPAEAEQYTFHSLLRHTERVDDRGSERTYTVTVDPEGHGDQWFDTLSLWVEDRGGLTDTMQVVIFYGYFPVTPRAPFPSDGSRNLNEMVVLRWGPAAPDPGVFTYTVYLGTSTGTLLAIESTTDTFSIVGSLVNDLQYFWRVTVTDGKETVEGPVWSFYNRNADAIVTFNTTETGVPIEENVAGVPVMLRLNTTVIPNINGSFPMQSGGFMFMSAGGDTLPYEIEQWDNVNREIDVWVLMDTIYAGTTDQSIAINYYPNGSDNGSGPAVFGDFAGVWHMEYTTGGFPVSDYTADASGNNHTGTYNGFGIASTVTGIAGDAAAILNDRYISAANSQSIYSDEPFMIETWVMIPAGQLLSVQYQPLVVKGDNPPRLELDHDNQVFHFAMGNESQSEGEYCRADSTFELGRWYHICGRYDGTTATFFVNGIRQSTTLDVTSVATSNAPLYIGHHYSQLGRDFQGRLDEVRVSPTARGDAWIRASYEGANPDTRLFTIQPVE